MSLFNRNEKQTLSLILIIVTVAVAWAATQHKKQMNTSALKMDGKGFAVVELYTSEGCSSCPPAEELVANLQKEYADKPIYILAYHIDYFDRQGWKDPFSDPGFSARQEHYADLLHLQTVYTPQIIVNGETEFVGSDERALRRAMTAVIQRSPVGKLTITAKIQGDGIIVGYETTGPIEKSDLVIALIQKFAQSKVRGGENAGRLLEHVQIVRRLLTQSLTKNKGEVSLSFPPAFKDSTCEVIGLVQKNTDGSIESAARTELPISLRASAGKD